MQFVTVTSIIYPISLGLSYSFFIDAKFVGGKVDQSGERENTVLLDKTLASTRGSGTWPEENLPSVHPV